MVYIYYYSKLMTMKKILSLNGFLLALCFLVSSTAFSQVMTPRAGVSYTNATTFTDETVGAMFGFVYSHNHIQVSSDFNYYFDEIRDDEFTPFALNLDIRYVAYQYKKKFDVFPIMGVNYANMYTKEIGLNLGVGSTLSINKYLKIFSEYKYVFGTMDGSNIALGVQFQYPEY